MENISTETLLPSEGTRCTDVLSDTLRGYAGIQNAELDLQSGRLSMDYDPQVLNDEDALRLVRKAGEQAFGRVIQCAARSDGACKQCAAQMNATLAEKYHRLAQLGTAAQMQFQNGRMEISIAGSGQTALHTAQLDLASGDPYQAPAIPVEPAEPETPTLDRGKLEILFTLVNAVAAVLAFAGEQFGFLPPVAIVTLYGTAYVTGGFYGLLDGLGTLRERKLDVNLLMIFAALGAAAIGQPAEGAALLFLFSLSNTLQTYAMDRSRKAIEKLLDLRPPVALVRRGSRLTSMPVEKLVIGDTVLVKPGERIPIDGEVISGVSTVDQAAITGESVPVEKNPGSMVFAGTVNGAGSLEIRATRLAKDTTLAKIVQMVEDAQASKARTQRMLDDFEQIYALIVLGVSALLIVVPYFFLNAEFYPTFYQAMTLLVVASPCALVISTPASILSAIANGARRGVLFKGGAYLEQTATLKVIAFDKTGTLTKGAPTLNYILPQSGISETDLLRLAATVEERSEHPLARAIVQAAQDRGIRLAESTGFHALPGRGVEAYVDENRILIGNERLFSSFSVEIPEGLRVAIYELETQGQTAMLVRSDDRWMGILAVADDLRPDAADIVQRIKASGVDRVVMLTGDNERVAAAIAARAGVDEFHAGLLPEDKVRLLKQIQAAYGPTAMVGDGVNDAPALAAADVGIAMGGAGTDVALETADVVLMADDLDNIPYAIGLAHKARRIVWQNLAFSLAVIVVLVVSAFGAQLPLPLGVVGHEGSTVLVVLNGLRLLGYDDR